MHRLTACLNVQTQGSVVIQTVKSPKIFYIIKWVKKHGYSKHTALQLQFDWIFSCVISPYFSSSSSVHGQIDSTHSLFPFPRVWEHGRCFLSILPSLNTVICTHIKSCNHTPDLQHTHARVDYLDSHFTNTHSLYP